MRLLLDANLSPARIGGPLGAAGHDVLALASDAALGALADPEVLRLAAGDGRILITRNSRDFTPLLRLWSEAGRHHAGCVLIWSLQHHQFAQILRGLERLFAERPGAEDWEDLAVAL